VYWDAIDNTGTGVHDPNATTWKNLGTGGFVYDLTIDKGVWTGGNSLSNGICTLAAHGSTYYAYTTGEFVIENYKEAYSDDATRFVFADKDRGLSLEKNLAQFAKNKCMTDFGFGKSFLDGIHTLAYDHGNSFPYFNGSSATPSDVSSHNYDGYGSPYSGKFFLGVNVRVEKPDDLPDADYSRGFHGKYYAIRLYSRSLGVDEISWNRKVDAVRFQGALPRTNIVVVANEWSGKLGGPYEVAGSCIVKGSPSSLDGKLPDVVRVWTLQDDGTWGNRVVLDGASYTYDVGTSPETVCIEFSRKVGFCIICR
jgi:hypothetical protein